MNLWLDSFLLFDIGAHCTTQCRIIPMTFGAKAVCDSIAVAHTFTGIQFFFSTIAKSNSGSVRNRFGIVEPMIKGDVIISRNAFAPPHTLCVFSLTWKRTSCEREMLAPSKLYLCDAFRLRSPVTAKIKFDNKCKNEKEQTHCFWEQCDREHKHKRKQKWSNEKERTKKAHLESNDVLTSSSVRLYESGV